jgi:uncharacterized membrane protein
MKKANQIVYGIFGAGALLFGIAELLFPGLLISDARFPMTHLLREEGAAGIFIGLMAIWCIFNYEKRAAVHYFLIVFAFLIAAIHWFDYLTGHLNWMSPLYNTVPFIVLALMALLSRSPAAVSEG